MGGGIDIGNTNALIHGTSFEIVIPGEPVLGGELFIGQSHHLRIACTIAGFLPDHAQGSNDAVISIEAIAAGANEARLPILHSVICAYARSTAKWNGVPF